MDLMSRLEVPRNPPLGGVFLSVVGPFQERNRAVPLPDSVSKSEDAKHLCKTSPQFYLLESIVTK